MFALVQLQVIHLGKMIFFYNGNPSNSMPESGEVTYKGESIMADKGIMYLVVIEKAPLNLRLILVTKNYQGSLNVDSPKYDVESGKVNLITSKLTLMPIFQAINFTVLQNPPLLFPQKLYQRASFMGWS